MDTTRGSVELKRGTLEMIMLRLLAEEPMYGFQLITALRERTAGAFEMKEGTLYPVLYRMEEGGLIEPQWHAEGRGVPRKYYHITVAGRAELDRLTAEWRAFSASIDRVLGGARTTDRRHA